MAYDTLLAFWLLSVSLIVVPGQDWALMIPAGMKRATVPALLGIALGYTVISVVVAAGLGIALASHPNMLFGFTLLGAAYLTYLGISMIRKPAIVTTDEQQAIGFVQWFRKGFMVSSLNVKGLLLLIAILPQFLDKQGNWTIPAQMFALGMLFTLSCTFFYGLVGAGAQCILSSRPAVARRVSRCSGVILLGIAVSLVIEQSQLLI